MNLAKIAFIAADGCILMAESPEKSSIGEDNRRRVVIKSLADIFRGLAPGATQTSCMKNDWFISTCDDCADAIEHYLDSLPGAQR